MRCYMRMMPALRADETARQIRVQLFAGGRTMKDDERGMFERELDEARDTSGTRRPRARATLGFLASAGIQIAPDEPPS